jgi:hypothetical protein
MIAAGLRAQAAGGGGTAYLDGWTTAALSLALLVAGMCLLAGLRGRPPGTWTITATVVLQLAMLTYLARYAVAMATGDGPVGPAWELWAYLVTVGVLPALGLAWAREEQSRWGTLVLAVVAVVAAVMCGRVAQIWYGVGVAPT